VLDAEFGLHDANDAFASVKAAWDDFEARTGKIF